MPGVVKGPEEYLKEVRRPALRRGALSIGQPRASAPLPAPGSPVPLLFWIFFSSQLFMLWRVRSAQYLR